MGKKYKHPGFIHYYRKKKPSANEPDFHVAGQNRPHRRGQPRACLSGKATPQQAPPLASPSPAGRYPHRRAHRAPAPPPQTADRPPPGRDPRPNARTHGQRRGGGGVRAGGSGAGRGAGVGGRLRGLRGRREVRVGELTFPAAVGAPSDRAPRRPRRRPAAGAGTPGRRRGGAGICPARRPGACNGAGSSWYSVPVVGRWPLGACFRGRASALGFLSWVVDPGGSEGRFRGWPR